MSLGQPAVYSVVRLDSASTWKPACTQIRESHPVARMLVSKTSHGGSNPSSLATLLTGKHKAKGNIMDISGSRVFAFSSAVYEVLGGRQSRLCRLDHPPRGYFSHHPW